jgi:hypothetical protein
MSMASCRCIHKRYNRQRLPVQPSAHSHHTCFMYRAAACLLLLSLTSLSGVRADDPWELDITEQELKEIADGALTMSFRSIGVDGSYVGGPG